MKRVYLLMGGLYSFDGVLTSAGMNIVADQLRSLPDVEVKTYAWANFMQCYKDQAAEVTGDDKMILVGYSGGGWRICTVAALMANKQARHRQTVDLLVAYDPSPWWNTLLQENLLQSNVRRAVCYQNSQWMPGPFGKIGGAKLMSVQDGPDVEVFPISMNHLLVQYDRSLHKQTVDMVKAL